MCGGRHTLLVLVLALVLEIGTWTGIVAGMPFGALATGIVLIGSCVSGCDTLRCGVAGGTFEVEVEVEVEFKFERLPLAEVTALLLTVEL